MSENSQKSSKSSKEENEKSKKSDLFDNNDSEFIEEEMLILVNCLYLQQYC